MVANRLNNEIFNIVTSRADWAWPLAMKQLFTPRGVNLMIAEDVNGFIDIIQSRRVHAAIVDGAAEEFNGITVVKLMRQDYPRVPCLMLSHHPGQEFLDKALQLNVFSVIDKPVDMRILRKQLNRIFTKMYDSYIFS